MESREFIASLVAGGCAGMCVDLTLFPLDTIKTRLQSQQGFYRAGGFRGIYAGVPSAALGSFPSAAAFFVTYEYTKSFLGSGGMLKDPSVASVTHMLAASLGETVACLIRVPAEVVKQRTQVSTSFSTYHMLVVVLKEEGVRGLYRGFSSTVLREIPFSLVQFPLWEYLKTQWSQRRGHTLHSWQAALCGAFAGAVAALVTNPLDVAKTRIMLAKDSNCLSGCLSGVLTWLSMKSKGSSGRWLKEAHLKTKLSLSLSLVSAKQEVKQTFLSLITPLLCVSFPLSVCPRPAQPRRAATSHWCFVMCGSGKGLPGCLQAAYRG
ncbi:mitochondrial S-adenosylmethionine carrier protein isoform 2-T2 [Syngnathus typhle]